MSFEPHESLSSHVPATPDQETIEDLFLRLLALLTERGGGLPPTLRDWVELAEAWRIGHTLRQCRGNRSAAARLLGIGRRTLYTKMEKFGIEPTYSPTWPLRPSDPA